MTLVNDGGMACAQGDRAGRRALAQGSGLVLLCGVLVVTLASAGMASGNTSAQPTGPPLVEISVLSNRADLVSGGDALVEIAVSSGRSASSASVTLNGRATELISHPAQAARPDSLVGLVTGLELGVNQLTATLPSGHGATIEITNHPNEGPIFSGPHRQPWACQPGAVDEHCNQPPEYQFLYQPQGREDLQPYDPDDPPSDVGTTTTDEGKTVPFIVRQEIGYQNRSQYTILVLFDPSQPWEAQDRWNHKVFIPHGGGCGGRYGVSEPPLADQFPQGPAHGSGADAAGPLSNSYVFALGRGFSVLSTALTGSAPNCDIALQAESLVMAKEHLTEQYGVIRYTIGSGCSGGALHAQQVANAYPGTYQGLAVTCAHIDFWGTQAWFMDTHLLALYFYGYNCSPYPETCTESNSGVPHSASPLWTEPAMSAAIGRPFRDFAGDNVLFNWVQGGGVNPYTSACAGIPEEDIYHPDDNPDGIRCSNADWGVNVLGRRLPAVWTEAEQEIGHGFGGRPSGNVGIMYGLEALESGAITTEQFVHLNTNIGSVDIDLNVSPDRDQADQPALEYAYRSGSINDASNLDQVAIVAGIGPPGPYAHPPTAQMEIRARLDREHGQHGNHVLWEGPSAFWCCNGFYKKSLIAVDRWLAAVEADNSDKPLNDKLLQNRPDDIRDACVDDDGNQIAAYGDPGCPFVPIYEQPRQVAGAPETNDVNACQLKPLVRADYGVTFTDAQWAQLRDTFPQGVCDYSKPGISQEQPTVAWQTYQDADGRGVPGGRAMPPPPVSTPFGPSADTAPAAGPSADTAPAAPSADPPLPATGGGPILVALVALWAAWLLRRPRPEVVTGDGEKR